jgi:hypothetical protein
MFGLRHVIAMLTNAVLVGTFLVIVLSMGWDSWPAIVGAIALGFALSYPVGKLIARQIKTEDPLWNEQADRPTAEAVGIRAAKAAEPEPPGPVTEPLDSGPADRA